MKENLKNKQEFNIIYEENPNESWLLEMVEELLKEHPNFYSELIKDIEE